MSVILPDFKDRNCLEATFCGFILAAKYAKKAPFEPLDRALIAEYKQSGEKVHVRLALPFPIDEDGDVHIHIDLASARLKPSVKPNTGVDELLAKLDPFIGEELQARLSGRFRAASLPPLIRPTIAEYSVGDTLTVRMTGGTLAVRGAPIQRITWQLLDKGRVDITLETRTDRTLDESHFVTGLDLLESAFKALFVENQSERSEPQV